MATNAHSAPLAGTVISNQAGVTYMDSVSGAVITELSNTVLAIVQQVSSFSFAAAQTRNAAPGATVYFAHALTNTGNGSESFNLSIGDVFAGGFNLFNLNLYLDANGDGAPDNLTPITSTGLLAPGAVFRFVAAAQIPLGAPLGAMDQITVTASGTATASPAPAQSLVDTVTTSLTGPDLVLQKSHLGDFTVDTNNSFTLTVRNVGNQPTNNVVTVQDTLPAGLAFVPSLSGGVSWTCSAAGPLVTCTSPSIVPAQIGSGPGAVPGLHPSPLTIMVRPVGAALGTLPVAVTNNAVVSGGGEPLGNQGNNAASDSAMVQLPANLGGRVWQDIDHDRIYTPGAEASFVLAGWQVEVCPLAVLVCDASTRIGYAVTVADGTYSLVGLPAGDYKLQFRDPNNNIVNGTPVNGDLSQTGSVADPNRRFLFLTLAPGDNLAQQSLPLDPSGVVYDSQTRQPVAGASVVISGPPGFDPALHLLGGAGNVTQLTGPSGFYQYILLSGFPNGTYSLTVTPPAGYQAAPSALFPPQAGPLDPPAGCTFPTPQICSVDPGNLPSAPPVGVAPHYVMSFVLNAGDPDVVNNHIPIDPLGAGGGGAGSGLLVAKSASKQVAEIGDFVDYTVRVQNANAVALADVQLRDLLPAGFAYVAGSGRLGGVANNPVGSPPVFNLGAVAANSTVTLTYRVRLNPGAQSGTGINRAQAIAPAAGIASNLASVRVRVTGGVFSDKAYVLGKVFMDCNLNGVQDEGELGVPGVRLFLQDGTHVATDGEGKYSLYGLNPRTQVLKVDNTSLPPGSRMLVISNRQSGDAGSRFLDLHKGEMHRADFALVCLDDTVAQVQKRREAAATNQAETERLLKERLRTESTPALPADVRGQPASGVVGSASAGAPSATAPAAAPASAPGASFEPVTPGPLDDKNSNLPAAPAPAAASLPLEQMIHQMDNALGFIGVKDGDTLPYAQSAVRVKGPFGSIFKLEVNKVEVPDSRVGLKLALEEKQVQLWEYIGVALKPGENLLTVTRMDQFGNPRGAQSIKLIAPADLGKIVIEAPKEASADGRSRVSVKVRLTDDKGVPVTVRTGLTLEAGRAKWQIDDVNRLEPGIQVFIEGGVAEFALLAPGEPGDEVLRISSGILKTEHRISFLPDLRPMIAAGLIEGAINLRSLNLRNLVAPRARDSFEQEIQRFSYESSDGKRSAAARAALFLKGSVKGEYLLTLAYDSDKNLKERLFRDIQPDEFYPVYGDSSVRAFDAQSTQRLYVRVDKGKSFVLYGDFLTGQPSEARKLADYSRSMTGLQSHYENDQLSVNAFASQDTLRQLVEELAANGTSGPYQLANRSGVINSEKVEILTRDRDQPALIIKTEPQSRFADYEIEVFTGRILFKGPVASLDQNLNPRSIRVTYEVDQGGEKFWTAGVNAQYKLTDTVEIGASIVQDRNPLAPFRLGGLNSTIKLGEKTWLIGEVAHSSNLAGSGSAARIELRHEDDKLKARLSAGRADTGFDNPAAQLGKGRTEVTGLAAYKLDAQTTLSAEALHSADELTGGRRNGLLVKAEHQLEDGIKLEAGIRHSNETTSPAQPGSAATPGATPNSVTSVRLRASAPVPRMPQATVFGEYEQSIGDSGKLAAVGGEYQLEGRGKLYLRHEFISSLGSPFALNPVQTSNRTVFGIDTDYAPDQRFFSEYRMRDTLDGRAAEAAIGLRSGWNIAEGLKLTTSSERVQVLAGPATGQSQAYTAGLEYTALPGLKASGVLELRNSTQSNSLLFSVGAANKLDDEWTTLARAIHSATRNKGAAPGDLIQTRLQAGLAFRDLATNQFNALGRVEYRNEEDGTLGQGPSKRQLAIGSVHMNYQPEASLLLSGRVASKFVSERALGVSSKSATHLIAGRLTMDLSRDWDIGVHASMLASNGLANRQFGVGAEVGYQAAQNMWLSVGFNALGFKEKDISQDPTERGVYLRLRYKFDEDVFKAAKDKPAPVYAAPLRSAKDAIEGGSGAPALLPGQTLAGATRSTAAQPGVGGGVGASAAAGAASAEPLPATAQALMDTAQNLLAQGKAQEAFAMLQAAESELIGDLRFDYLIGVAALDAGKPDLATLALNRVIAANPLHAGARIDYARALIQLGQKDLAQGELETVLAMDPPAPARLRIHQLLKDARPPGRLTGYLAASAGYDSNFNFSPSQSSVFVPLFNGSITLSGDNVGQAGSFASLGAGLRYSYQLDSDKQLFAGIDVTQRDLQGTKTFDSGGVGLYAGASLLFGRHELKGTLQWATASLGGEADRDTLAVGGEWNYALANGKQLGLSLRHAQVRMSKPALRMMDFDQTSLSAGIGGALNPRTSWSAGAFGGVDSDIHGNPFGQKTFVGARAGVQYLLRHDLSAEAGVSVQRALWDKFNLAFQTERTDTLYSLNLGLKWRFKDGWSLEPRLSFGVNRSSLPIYSYKRNELSLTLRREWE